MSDVRERPTGISLGWKLFVVAANMMAGAALFFAALVYTHANEQNHALCVTNATRLVDKEHQLAQTHDYLRSAVAKDRSFFNSYIKRVSLPRLTIEIGGDRKALPPSCRDEYRALRRR